MMIMNPLINYDAMVVLERLYAEICVAKNAYQHDLAGYNDNYDQRLLALQDFAVKVPPIDLCNRLGIIEYQINKHEFTRDPNSDYIEYIDVNTKKPAQSIIDKIIKDVNQEFDSEDKDAINKIKQLFNDNKDVMDYFKNK